MNKNLTSLMTKNPLVVNENMTASKALSIMNERKITSLLVVSDKDFNQRNKVLKGIIHIHFLLQNGINKIIWKGKKLRLIQISLLFFGVLIIFLLTLIKKKF